MKTLKYWQKKLNLNDWRIKLNKDCKASEMLQGDYCGQCELDEVSKAAIISIISKAEYGDGMIPYDYEKTLLHELLHLKFCLLDDNGDTVQGRVLHQIIDEFSRILVELRRKEEL